MVEFSSQGFNIAGNRQNLVNTLFKEKGTITIEEFKSSSIYTQICDKLSENGKANLNSIMAMDGDNTTISKSEFETLLLVADEQKNGNGEVEYDGNLSVNANTTINTANVKELHRKYNDIVCKKLEAEIKEKFDLSNDQDLGKAIADVFQKFNFREYDENGIEKDLNENKVSTYEAAMKTLGKLMAESRDCRLANFNNGLRSQSGFVGFTLVPNQSKMKDHSIDIGYFSAQHTSFGDENPIRNVLVIEDTNWKENIGSGIAYNLLTGEVIDETKPGTGAEFYLKLK